MYVNEYFSLGDDTIDHLESLKNPMDPFGEFIYMRTYARGKVKESWVDTIVRVINGVMSIRKDHYVKNHIYWDDSYWQSYASRMAVSMFHMKWLPPGRGLWMMGTDFIAERGSMALFNCAATKLGDNSRFANDIHWMMDALMLGVGVGFEPLRDNLQVYTPRGQFEYSIMDTREDWCNSVKLLIEAYTVPGRYLPKFNYDLIRPEGQPIKGFGGLSSGPRPLIHLHKRITELFSQEISSLRLKTDIANEVGCCVVAGNVRRSAELCKGWIGDQEFLELKNYSLNPERENFGYMSNNSAYLLEDSDFEKLGEVAKRVVTRGEPGLINLRNFKYGRIGHEARHDDADLLNPCGEIPLEDKELCNVVETLPTRCNDDWLESLDYATFYASTVSLLPTHREETNKIILKNRRIGVGIVDITGWIYEVGMNQVISNLRKGYTKVREINKQLNTEAGVQEAIRVTTIKPGGTIPKMAGRTAGISWPTFRHTIMNVRVSKLDSVCEILDAAGVPSEPEVFNPDNTLVYKFPVLQGPAKPAEEVSLWEQMNLLIMMQREWADNAVSNTLYFKPRWKLVDHQKQVTAEIGEEHYTDSSGSYKKVVYIEKWPGVGETRIQAKIYKEDPNHEEDIIEQVLASGIGQLKSCSLLPHSSKGVYRQMPQEGVTEVEFAKYKPVELDWTGSSGVTEVADLYCSSEGCVR